MRLSRACSTVKRAARRRGGIQMNTIANSDRNCNSATVKPETVNIILGAYRVRGSDWLDVIGMVLNGTGLIRDGNAYRLIQSEAYEQGALS